MESTNKKILTMSFIGAGVLLAFVVRVLVQTITPATSGVIARTLTSDFVVHILPAVLGFGFFLYLQLSKAIVKWADEVVSEIKKVVWPSRKDTVAMTIVVIVMCLISAVVIWAFDVASAFFVNYLVTL